MATSLVRSSGALSIMPLAMPPEGLRIGTPARRSTAGLVLADRLRRQVRAMLREERRFRSDLPDAEHAMRVAVRRLRSALRTFGPLVADEHAAELQEELRWLAGTFGAVRDHLVLSDRLHKELDRLPPEPGVVPVRARIDERLTGEVTVARNDALVVLDGRRYRLLVDRLTAFNEDPPFQPAADRPARQVLPPLVLGELRRLRRQVSAALVAPAGVGRDLAFHRARKTAKRVRYAAETLRPLAPGDARGFVSSLTTVQDILGDRQDAVVAVALLRDLGAQAGDDVGVGYTFGLLAGLEAAQVRSDEQLFAEAWARFDRKRTWRWLR